MKANPADDNLHNIPVIMISVLDEMESVVRCIEKWLTTMRSNRSINARDAMPGGWREDRNQDWCAFSIKSPSDRKIVEKKEAKP